MILLTQTGESMMKHRKTPLQTLWHTQSQNASLTTGAKSPEWPVPMPGAYRCRVDRNRRTVPGANMVHHIATGLEVGREIEIRQLPALTSEAMLELSKLLTCTRTNGLVVV